MPCIPELDLPILCIFTFFTIQRTCYVVFHALVTQIMTCSLKMICFLLQSSSLCNSFFQFSISSSHIFCILLMHLHHCIFCQNIWFVQLSQSPNIVHSIVFHVFLMKWNLISMFFILYPTCQLFTRKLLLCCPQRLS